MYLKLIFLLFISSVQADMNFRPRNELLDLGFKKQKLKFDLDSTKFNPSLNQRYLKHSLNWPIELKKDKHQFIANHHQIQTYTNPAYYHAGLDILADKDQLITSPISGTIEAGYYSYTDDYYGNTEKFFLPLKEALKGEVEIPWGKAYFEIAVIDDQGMRFEFHHVDSEDIPPLILDKILSGHQKVKAGKILGKVYDWKIKKGKIELRHIHYNIINNKGHYLNPFNFSPKVFDFKKPNITHIYATKKSICHKAPELIEFQDSPLETNGEIIVRTYDIINDSSLSKAPVLIKAEFENGKSFVWDFRDNLIDENTNKRHQIRDVYLFTKCVKRLGSELRASRNHDFFFRIPVAKDYRGKIIVTVYDQMGNSFSKTVEVLPQSVL